MNMCKTKTALFLQTLRLCNMGTIDNFCQYCSSVSTQNALFYSGLNLSLPSWYFLTFPVLLYFILQAICKYLLLWDRLFTSQPCAWSSVRSSHLYSHQQILLIFPRYKAQRERKRERKKEREEEEREREREREREKDRQSNLIHSYLILSQPRHWHTERKRDCHM